MLPSTYQKMAHRTECDQQQSRRRMSGGPNDLTNIRLNHAFLGICSEGGELFAQFQKHVYYGKALDRDNVKEELGDVMWYVAEACNALGLDLGDVMSSNIAKLRARFPDKFTEERAAEENRDRRAEAEAVLKDPPGGEA